MVFFGSFLSLLIFSDALMFAFFLTFKNKDHLKISPPELILSPVMISFMQ